jgi:hypothetical protein
MCDATEEGEGTVGYDQMIMYSILQGAPPVFIPLIYYVKESIDCSCRGSLRGVKEGA